MKSGLATFDFGGTALFVIGTCLLILGVTSGGTQHPWKSYQVLVPLIIGAIMFTSFFYYEYLLEPGHAVSRQFPSQVAMIPWKLFERKDTFLMIIVNAATGAALYSAFYFVGIFWTVAEGESPGKAGTQLLYYTPGIGSKSSEFAFCWCSANTIIQSACTRLCSSAISSHDRPSIRYSSAHFSKVPVSPSWPGLQMPAAQSASMS